MTDDLSPASGHQRGPEVPMPDRSEHHLRPRQPVTAAKRAFDIGVGLVLILATLPLLALLALVLAVQLRGWPFFVHTRIGRNGRPIAFPKLRTLSRDTPRYADKTVVQFEPVSRLAHFLREKHLDELPQLVLVPLGRLSLVGPRPRMASEVDHYPFPPFDAARTAVRQGCTGLWQVGMHTVATVSASPEYDLYYLRHSSFRMDLWILWRTAVQAAGGRAMALAEVPRWVRGRGMVAIDDPTWASMVDVDGLRAALPVNDPSLGIETGPPASRLEGEPA